MIAADHLHAAAKLHAHRPMAICGDEVRTYADMEARTNRLANALLALGLQKLAVEPEERHLLGKFGDAYRAYMARTRRWL